MEKKLRRNVNASNVELKQSDKSVSWTECIKWKLFGGRSALRAVGQADDTHSHACINSPTAKVIGAEMWPVHEHRTRRACNVTDAAVCPLCTLGSGHRNVLPAAIFFFCRSRVAFALIGICSAAQKKKRFCRRLNSMLDRVWQLQSRLQRPQHATRK